jgi:hypothetical protein
MLTLGLSAAGSVIAGQAMAGCGAYSEPGAVLTKWDAIVPSAGGLGSEHFIRTDFNEGTVTAGIVGLWQIALISDGTAYPAPIPAGAVVDFGTAQWHSDGTEIMVSGGRPPSTADVCMGVWEMTGPNTYKLKHVALSWISGDTPPPLGPVSPAVFVGPAIIREVVTLDRSRNTFEGTFTIDQYARDQATLLQHIGGKITGTRITVD